MTSHQLPFAVNCSILFPDLPVLDRASAAAAAGFTAVEFWWPFATATPDEAEIDAFVDSITAAGVRLIGLNFFAGDMPAGDRGVVSWPGRESEFGNSVEIATEIGRRLGTQTFNALYGNRVEGVAAEVQDEVAVENLLAAATAVNAIGGSVVLEPVSGSERYPLRTAADAAAVMARMQHVGAPGNVGLLADFYHLAVNGDDVEVVIDTYADQIRHVQIADAPGRQEPGTGDLPLDEWLARAERAGYSGWVALEYKPSSPRHAFEWLPRERRAAAHPAQAH
jgi:hydroxypyruvate isomerase